MVDVLRRLISRGVDGNQMKSFEVEADKLMVSHLQLTDDTVLFLVDDNGTLSSLHIFHGVLGIKINLF